MCSSDLTVDIDGRRALVRDSVRPRNRTNIEALGTDRVTASRVILGPSLRTAAGLNDC